MISSERRVDVVVVGAGISGLAVAAALIEAGLTVSVLESRDRVGGRLHSPAFADGAARIDLGASWFWPQERRVRAIADERAIATYDAYLSGDAVYHDPSGTKRIDGNPIDVPSFRFRDGAAALPEALAADLPEGTVRLATSAQRIEQTTDAIIVHTAEHRFVGEHAVIALPPALAGHALTFSPALPDRLNELLGLTPVWMGSSTKVVVRYAEPFWRRHGLSGSGISHVGPMREIHDLSGPDGTPAAVFGFVSGPAGAATVSKAAIEAQMVELFGPEAENPLEIMIADWRLESETSPPGVEQLTAYQAFGHSLFQTPALDGRLHWTSTETATVAPGHIEGALAAAERTTHAILRTIEPDPSQEIER